MKTSNIFQQNDFVMEFFPTGDLEVNTSLIYNKNHSDCLIIDPGNSLEELLPILAKKNLVPKLLLHTHAHFDHIGISGELKRKFAATIHLHEADKFLYDMIENQGRQYGMHIPRPEKIDHFFSDNFSTLNSTLSPILDNSRVLHTPGHSPGGVAFFIDYFSPALLFSGDTLFFRSIGRDDLPGGDGEILIKSIQEKIFTLPENTIIIPGHGPTTTVFDEKNYNPYVRNIRSNITFKK